MNKELLISIITVNYNDANGLEKTIKSVQSQTYCGFEHIIIDGNSTDGSKAFIEKYKNSFSYWVSEPDSGIYNAMNKGIKVAKGEYLLFLNSGDTLYDDIILNKVYKKLSKKLDIYYGDLVFCSKKSNKVYKYPHKLTFGFFYEKSLPHPATFIKRTLFDTVFFYNENYKVVSDWEFFICTICKFNASYKYLDFIISNFNTEGLSSKKENIELIIRERESSLNNFFPLFIKDTEKLIYSDKLLKTNRFKMLLELEKSTIAKKINSIMLRVLLRIFRRTSLKRLNNE